MGNFPSVSTSDEAYASANSVKSKLIFSIVREGASYLRVDESNVTMEDPISAVVGSLATSLGISDVTMQLLIGSLGLVLMSFSFHRHSESYAKILAITSWPFIGLFFYLYSGHFVEIADPVLIFMTAGALPVALAISYWEWLSDSNENETIVWLRGFVVWSMIPYYVVFGIPYLNMAFVQFTAVSAELMLEFAGFSGYEIGSMMIERDGEIAIPVLIGRGIDLCLASHLERVASTHQWSTAKGNRW